jgi:hypothetical protein
VAQFGSSDSGASLGDILGAALKKQSDPAGFIMARGVDPRLKGADEEREIWDRERGCRCGSNLPPCGADVTAGDRGG